MQAIMLFKLSYIHILYNIFCSFLREILVIEMWILFVKSRLMFDSLYFIFILNLITLCSVYIYKISSYDGGFAS